MIKRCTLCGTKMKAGVIGEKKVYQCATCGYVDDAPDQPEEKKAEQPEQ